MNTRNGTARRIAAATVAGAVAVAAYTFGISTSPGSARGAGFTTSPSTRIVVDNDVEPPVLLLARKAGKGQQDYL